MTAPVKPKGIADIIISGCKYDLNGTAKSTYTTKSANAKFLNNELNKIGIKVKSMRNESNRLEELFIETIKNKNE